MGVWEAAVRAGALQTFPEPPGVAGRWSRKVVFGRKVGQVQLSEEAVAVM